jgi:hypothetical protein
MRGSGIFDPVGGEPFLSYDGATIDASPETSEDVP